MPQGERWAKMVVNQPDQLKVKPLLNIKRDQPKPYLMVFPGAKYGPAKQWDANSYASIINMALNKGWEVGLYGTKDESEIGHEIAKSLKGNVPTYFGTHNLKALMDHIETLNNPICLANDSGAMHFLSACGVPTLGMYFSTSAKNTPPAFGKYKILEADIACRPCYKRTCPLEHYDCRKKITIRQVWDEITQLPH